MVAATVYQIDQSTDDTDNLMHFKVWCNDNDPQKPKDSDTKLWFDFSDEHTEVAVIVKHAKRTLDTQ